ncbi:MAG: 30S ribosomal protein S2, partial [Deltaproteobacteria bacterium]|nr:30S ribosomal protein S2 [Deltaproteobacteria bacterium]
RKEQEAAAEAAVSVSGEGEEEGPEIIVLPKKEENQEIKEAPDSDESVIED